MLPMNLEKRFLDTKDDVLNFAVKCLLIVAIVYHLILYIFLRAEVAAE